MISRQKKMAPSFLALFISMLFVGAVTCYVPEVASRMLVENSFTSTISSTPTSKDGTRDIMSVIPSTPTRRNDEGQESVRREIDMNGPARMIDCDDVEEEDNQVIMVSSPSITVSRRGTRNFMSTIPSIPTNTIPSIPTIIIHHGSRKILLNRRLIVAKGSRMPIENSFTSTISSTPTSKDETRNFISTIPSTPTSKDETRNFMSVIPSTPTSKDETPDFMSVIPSTQSRKILRHRHLIEAKGSISPNAPGN
ncbi:uncharacterized protein LOC132626144 isoform X2 [Lycium barbarum]|uniref:uncharacterized protein LOC132626144 isoform X2 n=1 Tax=Lycium barbarum TaxID=112863 RepID=UPI00293EE81C|nr:uncharacterized protein LOC132626144 isoform X2 [Lycium barbarum]